MAKFFLTAEKMERELAAKLKEVVADANTRWERSRVELPELRLNEPALDLDKGEYVQRCYDDAEFEIRAEQEYFFTKVLERTARLEALAAQVAPKRAVVNTYDVTVRPKEGADFAAFRTAVETWLAGGVLSPAVWSFEQKGVAADALGHGFHVHICGRRDGTFPSTLAQEAVRVFKHFCGPAGVRVRRAKTPAQYVQGYLVRYESSDGHKAATMVWDDEWRQRLGLAGLYGDVADELFQESE